MTDFVEVSQAEKLGLLLSQRGWFLALAESCTGGRVAAAITAVPGSSAWFECGVVSYANRIKNRVLQVQESSLNSDGAVSEVVVTQMAQGVCHLSGAQVAIAISGIAGPSGGSAEKPVGTVWFAWQTPFCITTTCKLFSGDRNKIQSDATEFALQGLLELLDSE